MNDIINVSYLGGNEFVSIPCSLFRCILGFFGHTHGDSPRFSVPASMAISVLLEIDHVADAGTSTSDNRDPC